MKREKDTRPWGTYERFTHNELATVKILTIKPRQQFSLQYHNHRLEFWKFLDNSARVTIGNKKFSAKAGDEFMIPKRTLHRIQAGAKPVRVLEISFGKFSERDIVRVEDDYNRK